MSWDSRQYHWNLSTRRFGREIAYFEELDSTNRWLAEHISNFSLPGSVAVAGHQTHGRGRHARTWLDNAGQSLLCSILLFSERSFTRPGLLSLLPSIALAKICSRQDSRIGVALKWPNDVLINGRKVAGILAESHQHQDRNYYVVGVGVNIAQSREELEWAALTDASSIHLESSWKPTREVMLAQLLNELEELYELLLDGNFETIKSEWELFGPRRGASIRRVEGDTHCEGSFQGLGEFGQLLLQDNHGKLHEFYSGEAHIA